jgi:hypothetical protein
MDHVAGDVLVGLHEPGDDTSGGPPAEAGTINALRWRTALALPRRAIRCSFCPSSPDNHRTLTSCAIPALPR